MRDEQFCGLLRLHHAHDWIAWDEYDTWNPYHCSGISRIIIYDAEGDEYIDSADSAKA